ncbi:aspartate aminotransferase family protein [Streptomyces noursei]|uniref:Glutamate-1-semialdehyde 2,1-aminomutase n=1 Tax=Streptomyces noursei TaxID=1971 RepID=A0A401R9Z3_STRNR|nr:aminotransferase class III-fold pyridoxal phosphate-dependent enzyme [Streptomyces noursei]AKA06631.1 glutamate-1-semialdehyde 2,1-aminomutase [Streptomyces noursei ZPM]EXU92515.1 glutamate-1-semialdehyde 2,1-aminomutase [Streptomyces noursei PD-1]UWS75151.1 aminotransferase class III-fold pyridoxal phosphate-dependent enzyme [Streptomyces noursei]GCB94410.1 glutamate-1-semialdehyde 2,1-aminomutase [Streptomyces noursei]
MTTSIQNVAEPSREALAEALQQARDAYTRANPKSQQQFDAACAHMPGGNTRTVLFHSPFPLRIARGQDCRLWDADGHEYVNFLGDFTAGLFGHTNPAIASAVSAALANGISLSGHNELEARFAARICERFPTIDSVRFTNSGTEANLLALATATATTGRSKILVFDGAYHGSVMAFTGGARPTNVPHEWVIGTYNDIDGTKALLDAHGRSLAAVLVEPMLGSGGCVPADPEFLQLLREHTRESGALLILDEVMTSRLAAGGRQGMLDIQADLTTLGKYLGGGLSFGAFGGRSELMAAYDPRTPEFLAHAGTFNNNVLTMSAGVAALDEFTPDAADQLTARGDQLRTELNHLCEQSGAPMVFTGLGSLMTVHFTERTVRCGADVAAGDQELKELFFFDMLSAGIYLARRGMIVLSLPIGCSECRELIEAVASFIERRRHFWACPLNGPVP